LSLAWAAGLFLTFAPFLLGLERKYEEQKLGLAQQLLMGRLAYLQTQALYGHMFSAYLIVMNTGDGYLLNKQTNARLPFTYSQQGLGSLHLNGPASLNFTSTGSSDKRGSYTLAHRSLPLGARCISVQPVTGLTGEEKDTE